MSTQSTRQNEASHKDTLTLYYDGSCPLCAAEMHYLQHKDAKNLLIFVDITQAHFDAQAHQIDCEQAMQAIVGRLSSGRTLQGIEVFQSAYEKVELNTLAWLLGHPSLAKPLAWFYAKFARHRQRWSKLIGPLAWRWAQWLTRAPSSKATN